ncbi:MAG: M48 family metallopeptidase [Erysipelotrichaceae bacterium]|nr:M48 family metallopeptidase [Erysipelotrichaceae bacterium]
MRSIRVNDFDFLFDVKIKRANKNIYMRIKNQVLYFTSPVMLKDDFIKKMILKNYDEIYKKLTMPPLSYNTIHFLGAEYNIKLVKSNTNTIVYDQENFYIHTTSEDSKHIESLMHLFYAKELKKIVESNIDEIKEKFNIKFNITFQYKNVHSYYGECFHKKRHIILATRLCKYKLEYILNIIYHEMAHFYHQNHSKAFYELLEAVHPGYRASQRALKRTRYNDGY